MTRIRLKRMAIYTAACAAIVAPLAWASLTLLEQFSPPSTGSIVAMAVDPQSGIIATYGSFASQINVLDLSGSLIRSIDAPGEGANDVDLEVAPADITLNGIDVPAGSLLFINGEIDEAEIYAVDPVDGTVLATLITQFGDNHVVGGAYSTARRSLFLVHDRQGPTALDNLIAEIDPDTGSVLGQFYTGNAVAGFTVNFGDIEVDNVSGNLNVVSSDESTVLVLDPSDGSLIDNVALPAGVSGLSAIALDDSGDNIWVSSSSGLISRMALPVDSDADGVTDDADNCTVVANADQTDTDADGYGNACDADFNNDCVVNVVDLGVMRSLFFGADNIADLDGDGVTNVVDLGILRAAFFQPPGPSALTTACLPD